MRYTTVLDLREWPRLYANQNVRLVYLHLALISGYHDYNRDLTNISVRKLAEDTGITVSAVRNALKQLENEKIIKRKKGLTFVVKFLKEQAITPRSSKQEGKVGVMQPREIESTRNPNAISREEYERRKKEQTI